MAVLSKQTAPAVEDHGIVEDRSGALEGYTVSWTSFRGDVDMTPLLHGLPDDRCQCPHWGQLLSGRCTVRYADRVEVIEAGDAFYMAPGHVPTFAADSEALFFSPTDQLVATNEAIARSMAAMQQA